MTHAMIGSNPRPAHRPSGRRALLGVAAASAGALALTACTAVGGTDTTPTPTTTDGEAAAPSVVRLITHDSFAISDEVIAEFEESTGLSLDVVTPGDGGELVNQLILTVDSPLGDAVYGIDNSFASRAIEAGILDPHNPANLPASAEQYLLDDAGSLTPVNLGDVCLNIDLVWFDENSLTPPATLEDVLEEDYRDLTVVTNPATSSPGLAFLLATIGEFGEDGWLDYWSALADNGLRVADGWSDAYYVDFTGADGAGSRPIVLSYSTSPAFTVVEADDGTVETTTAALLDTCFRQVEYAGVISGAANPEGARALVDFLLEESFQADLPEQMYVYPIDDTVELPAEWAQFAPLAPSPIEIEPAEIAEHRDRWIGEWMDAVIG